MKINDRDYVGDTILNYNSNNELINKGLNLKWNIQIFELKKR